MLLLELYLHTLTTQLLFYMHQLTLMEHIS